MTKPLTLTNATAPARFDLAHTGLSEAQLKGIAGARPGEKSPRVTVADVTVCCWG
ncbi:hypothetical protein HNQ51_000027 [Inhella inkyongensis]|uniref:Uncharacterized protein n=1 Tax=Inhella inkyongensis TaxID=392593 RepID=A0A840S1J8_9BURK|nr:hypothetical protein [Inhella inkyongensis]MBB5202734.1 hypothetical protein [Inhella inkyongensis]